MCDNLVKNVNIRERNWPTSGWKEAFALGGRFSSHIKNMAENIKVKTLLSESKIVWKDICFLNQPFHGLIIVLLFPEKITLHNSRKKYGFFGKILTVQELRVVFDFIVLRAFPKTTSCLMENVLSLTNFSISIRHPMRTMKEEKWKKNQLIHQLKFSRKWQQKNWDSWWYETVGWPTSFENKLRSKRTMRQPLWLFRIRSRQKTRTWSHSSNLLTESWFLIHL